MYRAEYLEQADGGREVRRARIAPSRLSAQAGRQTGKHSSECFRCSGLEQGVSSSHATSEGGRGCEVASSNGGPSRSGGGQGRGAEAVEHGEWKLIFIHLQHQPQHRHRRGIALITSRLTWHMAHGTCDM